MKKIGAFPNKLSNIKKSQIEIIYAQFSEFSRFDFAMYFDSENSQKLQCDLYAVSFRSEILIWIAFPSLCNSQIVPDVMGKDETQCMVEKVSMSDLEISRYRYRIQIIECYPLK